MTIALALMLALAPPQGSPVPVSAPLNPRALELFERDWVLMDWALRFHDRDGDVRLSADEASAAGAAFKDIADGNRDGRVTPTEYRAAREFLLARY